MKKLFSFFLSALFICSGLFMTSCSKNNEQVFAKRKYMPWFKTLKQKKTQEPDVFITQNTYEVERLDAIQPDGEASLGSEINTQLLPKQKILWNSITKRVERKVAKSVEGNEYLQNGKATHIPQEVMSSFSQAQETEFKLNQHLKDNNQSAEVVAEGIVLILLVILAIILPPLAVLLVDGIGMSFLLSILLTLLFWIPGVIYALIRIFA